MAFKLGIKVDLCVAYMLMLVSMTLTVTLNMLLWLDHLVYIIIPPPLGKESHIAASGV